jgi:hypothetical protein
VGFRLVAGEHVTIRVRDWAHLGTVTVERKHGGRTRRSVLHLRTARTALLGAVKLRAKAAKGKLTVTARVTHRGRLAWTTAGVSFVVARGRHVVARTTVPLTLVQLSRRAGTVAWTLPKRLAAGRYTVVAIGTASALGSNGIAQTDLRSARAHARLK